MEDRLSFGKIHIVEWLRPGERRTGHEIYQAVRDMAAASNPRVAIILHRVSSRATFLARLRRIETDVRRTGKIPLLEIETHGHGDGIGLSDEGGLEWRELMEQLTPLNQLTGVRLPVIMAACEGIWGIKMAQAMRRAPFMALLGPNRPVFPGEIVRGMKAFYRGIFRA
jgi:hypothetical protein